MSKLCKLGQTNKSKNPQKDNCKMLKKKGPHHPLLTQNAQTQKVEEVIKNKHTQHPLIHFGSSSERALLLYFFISVLKL